MKKHLTIIWGLILYSCISFGQYNKLKPDSSTEYWFYQELVDRLSRKGDRSEKAIECPIQAILLDDGKVFFVLSGASERPLEVAHENESQRGLRLSFDKKNPLYGKYSAPLLQIGQQQLDLVVFDGSKPKDTLVFIKPKTMLKGKGFQQAYYAHLFYGDYFLSDTSGKRDTVTLAEDGSIRGLADFTSWDIGHASGITEPKLFYARAEIILKNSQRITSCYMVMDPGSKSWKIYKYDRDQRGIYNLKLSHIYQLVPILD